MRPGWDDVLVLLGLVLIGGALAWGAGWPGAVGFAGGLLVATGMVLAMLQARRNST